MMSFSLPNCHVPSFPPHQFSEEKKETIRKMFNKIDISISPYDTAWVAMVPSPGSMNNPCFPRCVNWLLNNQLSNGSWGEPNHHPLLVKDALLSTLASILALKQWGVGERQVTNGLDFIASNSASIFNENQHTPIGFEIIFSGMIKRAKSINLNLPMRRIDEEALRWKRDLELGRRSSEGKRIYLSYVSEGMKERCDSEMIMKYQRKNGSLFNSPSTTAAALSKFPNSGFLHYLNSILDKFGDAVPTVYPSDLYIRLNMVNNLISLGIDCHFKEEITTILDYTYRYWLKGEEEIFLDVATTAVAFRILRMHGYDVSSDVFSNFSEEDQFNNTLEGYVKDTIAVLELYKASQMAIYQDEVTLDKIHSWTSHFLKERLSEGQMNGKRLDKYIYSQVDDALRNPIVANLKWLGNKRSMKNYQNDDIQILKSTYRLCNKDLLNLAIDEFNKGHLMNQEELKNLERWVVESRLDKLEFARQKMYYSYFTAAATLSGPELADARIFWAKSCVLTTVVDDLFDVGGSMEELENLMHLLKKWDVNIKTECYSKSVEIIFSALQCTISEMAETALKWQGRDVTNHIIEIWLDMFKTMFLEAKWRKERSMPPVDEYTTNAFVSFGLGPIVLPALYFVGPKLLESDVRSVECNNLFMLVSACGRLLNDIMSFKRISTGKLNIVGLQMIHEGISEEDSINKINGMIRSYSRELLKMVLQEKGSVIPRACNDLFWNSNTACHLFYSESDGYATDDMIKVAKSFMMEPIILKRVATNIE